MEEDRSGRAGAKRKDRQEWHAQQDEDDMGDESADDDDEDAPARDWDRYRARRLVRSSGGDP
eukprot:4051822-Pyramimonas_sp.AAC.1